MQHHRSHLRRAVVFRRSRFGWVLAAAIGGWSGSASARDDGGAPGFRPVTVVSAGVGAHVGGVGFGVERRIAAAWLVRGALGAFALDGPAAIALGGGASWLSHPGAPNHFEVGASAGAFVAEDGPYLGVASLLGWRHLPADGGFDFRLGGGPAVLLVSAAGAPQGHVFLPELEVGWSF
jgi:hypothetical protein